MRFRLISIQGKKRFSRNKLFFPQMETLENRVQLGDALLSGILGSALLSSGTSVFNSDSSRLDVDVGDWNLFGRTRDLEIGGFIRETGDSNPSLIEVQVLSSESPNQPGNRGNVLNVDIPEALPNRYFPNATFSTAFFAPNPTADFSFEPFLAGSESNSIIRGMNGLPGDKTFLPRSIPALGISATPFEDSGRATQGSESKVPQNLGRVPLAFEANRGQTDSQVQFLAHGPGYTLFLTPTESVISLSSVSPSSKLDKHEGVKGAPSVLSTSTDSKSSVIRMQFSGSNPQARMSGLEEQAGKVNYFIGNDSTKRQTNVPTFARVEYQDIYPGIDLIYYGTQEKLEYDFVVSPGTNPNTIAFSVEGSDHPTVNDQGDLVMPTNGMDFVQHKPILYQEVNGIRREVAGNFVVQGNQVHFQVGQYDSAQPLVIDPVLSFSTYLGGSQDNVPYAVKVDSSGNVYVAGTTSSTDFPTTNGSFQRTYGGGLSDAFVTKLNPTGSALIYSTYLGGNSDGIGGHDGHDTAFGLAIDSQGNAYLAGETGSTDFPTTSGAFQRTFAGGDTDGFVTKLNPSGSGLVYSTFLGGSFDETCAGIAIDASGNAYIAGDTTSTDFPTTASAFQRNLPGVDSAFVTKLNANGTGLLYSTYLGGTTLGLGGNDGGSAIAVDSSGNAYLTGFTDSLDFPTTPGAFQRSFQQGNTDAFVAKINPNLSGIPSLVYSTYLGGDGDDSGIAIAVDSGGNAYVTGSTDSLTFPTTPGAFQRTNGGGDSDAFVTKVNPAGSGLVFSTYLGGSGTEDGNDISLDSAGNVYVTGDTTSANFPVVNALQGTLGGLSDAFVTKFNPAGSALVYSTYLGGSGDDAGLAIAVDSSQNVYVAGSTTGNFPITDGAFQQTFRGAEDAFVAKISDGPGPATHFRVTASPSTVMAGNPIQTLTVTALDAQEHVATGYQGTIHFTSQDSGATLPNDTPFLPGDNGVKNFPNGVILVTAGAQDITVTDTVTMSITGTTTVMVTPAPAAVFAFDMPSSTISGVPFTGGIYALDPYGNIDTNYQNTVTFTTTDPDPGVVLPSPYTFSPSDAGVVYFPNGFTLVTPGDQYIYANDTGSVSGSALVTVVPGNGPSGGSGPRGPNRMSLGSGVTTQLGQPRDHLTRTMAFAGTQRKSGGTNGETVHLDRFFSLFNDI